MAQRTRSTLNCMRGLAKNSWACTMRSSRSPESRVVCSRSKTLEVVAANALETITLTHEAHDRAVFATGALTAARWLAGRPAGRWSMADLAAEHLTTLTTPGAPAPHAAA